MPTISIDEHGTSVYYVDSGAPPGSTDYTTLIMYHGYVVHAHIFRRMFPHAAAHNLRIIAPNMREYPGSSQLSDSQLACFHSADEEEQETVIVELGKDAALFAARVTLQENLPLPAKVGGVKAGGVCLVSWSAGGATLMALLSYLPTFDELTRATLERYVTTLVAHDPPCLVLGIADPPKTYTPARDLKITPDQLKDRFMLWASTFFEPFADLNAVTAASVATHKEISDVPEHSPTYVRMSPEEVDDTTFGGVASRIGAAVVGWEISWRNTYNSLFDTKGTLPGIPIYVLWGAMSPWNVPWSARFISDVAEKPAPPGEQRRELHIERLEGLAHFANWDDPERMIRIFADHTK
ncbi:alpha/beta-hydrolase [Trametopsis cervina]|nr:alpha/beta-hydrolase [Trametopsis cervina]